MKAQFFIFSIFFLVSAYPTKLNAQKIKLEIKAEAPIPKTLVDSLLPIKVFKNFENLKNAVDSIPVSLKTIGYLSSKLKNLDKVNDSLYLANYYFGKKSIYIKVYFSEKRIAKKSLSKVIKKIEDGYFLLPISEVEKTLNKISKELTLEGNAFAKVSLTNITESKDTLISQLKIDRGEKRIVDDYVIKGYEKFPTSFLKHYANVKKNRTFNKEELLDKNERINALPFASSIKPPEVLFEKDSTTLYFYLKKENNNIFDGILGFATDPNTQKFQLNGYLNLALNNNLNFGESLKIKYKADGREQINLDATVELPYLIGTPFGVEAGLNIFKRDSTFATTQQNIKLNYQLNPSSRGYIGYKGYESSNLLNTEITATSIEDYESTFLLAGVSYSITQGNELFPIKTKLDLDVEIGNRRKIDNKIDQQRVTTSIKHILNLNYNNSIFLKNTTSLLFSDNYITNELFRFGGVESIRGFNENSIDASIFSVLNTEYRYVFTESVFVHSIIDFGYFENKVMEIEEKLFSFGIGAGIKSNAGLFRIIFANGNTEGQQFNFSNSKIHISLTSQF